jgi:hypothetical protein
MSIEIQTAEVVKMVEEFKAFELDPEKINTEKIHKDVLAIGATMELTSTARTRGADSMIASVGQVLGFKMARCHYWEKKLSEKLKYVRARVRLDLQKEARDAQTKLTADTLDDMVEVHAEVAEVSKALATANASRFFWEHLQDALKRAGDRVDNASMSLGVDAKIQPRPVQG